MLAPCRRQDVQTELMALRLQAIPTHRLRLDLVGTAPCLLLSLPGRDASLTTSLKARRYKVLLRDLALVFFVSDRPKGEELPEDNSSSAWVLTSARIMGSFPLLQVIKYLTQPLSRTSFPRSWLFSIWHVTGRSLTAIGMSS